MLQDHTVECAMPFNRCDRPDLVPIQRVSFTAHSLQASLCELPTSLCELRRDKTTRQVAQDAKIAAESKKIEQALCVLCVSEVKMNIKFAPF